MAPHLFPFTLQSATRAWVCIVEAVESLCCHCIPCLLYTLQIIHIEFLIELIAPNHDSKPKPYFDPNRKPPTLTATLIPYQVRGSPSVSIRVRRSVVGPVITDNGVAKHLGSRADTNHALAMLWIANDPSVSVCVCVCVCV